MKATSAPPSGGITRAQGDEAQTRVGETSTAVVGRRSAEQCGAGHRTTEAGKILCSDRPSDNGMALPKGDKKLRKDLVGLSGLLWAVLVMLLVAAVLSSLLLVFPAINEYPEVLDFRSLSVQLVQITQSLREAQQEKQPNPQLTASIDDQSASSNDTVAIGIDTVRRPLSDSALSGARGYGDYLHSWRRAPSPPPDLDAQLEGAPYTTFNGSKRGSIDFDKVAPDECKILHFGFGHVLRRANYELALLPAASIIITFYNEHPSVLYRTLDSVLNRTPPQLLEEVILIDDGSTFPFATETNAPYSLSKYIRNFPKVRLLRHSTPKGVAVARSTGIRAAKGRIFVVLDSHVEVGIRWLEPLVARVATNPNTVVFPEVDTVDSQTWEIKTPRTGCTLGLVWSLKEQSFPLGSPGGRPFSPGAYRPSPMIRRSVFAGDKSYFLQHGGYDEKMRFSGENIELSLRQWQCGGRVECSPCSRVFRLVRNDGNTESVPRYSVMSNKMRIMAVWMDEYAALSWYKEHFRT
ncbi:glycosyltransferase, group 2 family protein [Besnoitia besnoiti]|uniref:Glycosyltransferase, group 2 family protein n=1 Tax=Besnoitia besnoiti TaxID=94643 RepID=A0A2A9MAU0_BESBE|nr:glycosyltransferase, group 2 family protein [Besnoitia besnoiti]PFH33421.1 glycosyltransferase, group 2 family protein [Besnoitia besnoiti]